MVMVNSEYEPRIYRLLVRLREKGGWLISEGSCTPEMIVAAKLSDRHTLDRDGYGFVYIPPDWRPELPTINTPVVESWTVDEIAGEVGPWTADKSKTQT